MQKTIKLIALAIVLSIPFFIISCIGTNDVVPSRTAETEQQELNESLVKLEAAGYNIDTTELGVYYIMNKVGTGPFPQPGDTCKMIYVGFFLDGTIFDTSGDYFTDSIWQFQYKDINLIPGFDDAIGLLNKDAVGDFIIPSNLAYGTSGYNGIPPFTPLVFSLKMKDIRPKE